MGKLTQRHFAELYRTARKETGVKGTDLKARTGLSANTLSRYKDPAYASGPPDPGKRRALEGAMALPNGYLDGLVTEVSWDDVRRRLASAAGMAGDPAGQARTSALTAGKNVSEVKALILEQLAGYERRGQAIPPAQVVFWLSLMETPARGVTAGAGGAGPGETLPPASGPPPPGAARSTHGRRRLGGTR